MICIEKTNDLVTYQIVTNLIKLFSFENNEGYSVGKFLVVSYSDDKVNELLDSGNIITLSDACLPTGRRSFRITGIRRQQSVISTRPSLL